MLQIYNLYAYIFFCKCLNLSPGYGGGAFDLSSVSSFAYLVNNNTLILFSVFVNVSLPAFRVHYSLSAKDGSCSPGATSGGLQTAAAGFLYILGFTEFTEEKNEYYKEENVHRTG